MKSIQSSLRVVVTLLVVLLCSNVCTANSTKTFQYKINVKTNLSGAGKVYVVASKSTPNPKSTDYQEVPAEFTNSIKSDYNKDGYVWAQFYYYATEKVGYKFVEWRNSDNKTVLSTDKTYSGQTLYLTSTDSKNPTVGTFYAIYEKEGVVTVGDQNEGGKIEIDNIENGVGDNVTLKAIPSYNYTFGGWMVEGSESVVSTDNPYTFVVPNEKRKYVAKWIKRESPYYRIKSHATKVGGHYIGLIGNQVNRDYKCTIGTQNRTGVIFNGSLAMVDETDVYSDPGTVLKVSSTYSVSSWKLDFASQDIRMGDAIKAMAMGATGSLTDVLMDFTSIGTYRIHNTGDGTSDRWLRDGTIYYNANKSYGEDINGRAFLQAYMQGLDDGATWEIEPIDESTIETSYFGVTPTLQVGDKYYTTLYVTFPFKCYEADGVKAYYVDNVEDSVANCVEIVSGEVPSKTPVILECKGNTAKQNRLIPLATEPAAISGNQLKGLLKLQTSSTGTWKPQETPSSSKHLALDMGEGEVLFKQNDDLASTTSQDYSNTAYLDNSDDSNVTLSLFKKAADVTLDAYESGKEQPATKTIEEYKTLLETKPNSMAIVTATNAEAVKDVKNVIVDNGEGATVRYVCPDFELADASTTDDRDWASPVESFVATKLTYERPLATSGMNSVCMPFALNSSNIPEGATLWVYYETTESSIRLQKVDGVAAGTPCFMLNATGTWKINLDNVEILKAIQEGELTGTYAKDAIGAKKNSYRLNGGKFVKASSKTVIYPFRNYLSLSSSANVKEEFGLLFDEEATGIMDTNGNVEAVSGIYSVNGVKQTELRKGVNIVRMQDGTVKKILKK